MGRRSRDLKRKKQKVAATTPEKDMSAFEQALAAELKAKDLFADLPTRTFVLDDLKHK